MLPYFSDFTTSLDLFFLCRGLIYTLVFQQCIGRYSIQRHTYTIANFQVQLNKLVFKPSDHKYMVKFTRGTTVGDVNKHLIPDKTIKITPFGDIITGRWKKDILIGVNLCFYILLIIFFHFVFFNNLMFTTIFQTTYEWLTT